MDITVATLIYKSPAYLDFVMRSLITNHSTHHNVSYLIVCNDATNEVLDRAYFWTEHPKDDKIQIRMVEHTSLNPDAWWLDRVYDAWNRCLIECKTEAICFVNSDMAFTKGWLDNLAKHDLDQFIPTSRLVESERMPSLPGLISKNFGQTIGEFRKDNFESFAEIISDDSISYNVGAYMPSLFKTANLYRAGGWRKNWNNIPGDRITFGILAKNGLQHIMVNDSIAYHIQRGESFETGDY